MAMVSDSRWATEATASLPSTVRSRGVLMRSTESMGHAALRTLRTLSDAQALRAVSSFRSEPARGAGFDLEPKIRLGRACFSHVAESAGALGGFGASRAPVLR